MDAIRTILVHMDSSPCSRMRLQVAARLAGRLGAQATAAYAVTPTLVAHPSGFMPGGDAGALLVEFDDQRRRAAKALFDDAVAGGLSHLRWQDLAEEPVNAMRRAALYADLLVLGQREPKDGVRDVPADFVSSVVIGSGTPALVLPYIQRSDEIGRRVMLAWKEAREAARALIGAMPLLRSAERVDVTLWDEGYGEDAEVAARIETRLKAQGIEARIHRCGPQGADMGEQLLSRAADLDVDLLVMGCYGHSRAREWVLGGATHTILTSMTLPVLMAP